MIDLHTHINESDGTYTPAELVNAAVELGLLYALLFIPFTYYLDRFSYRRYLRKTGQQPTKR